LDDGGNYKLTDDQAYYYYFTKIDFGRLGSQRSAFPQCDFQKGLVCNRKCEKGNSEKIKRGKSSGFLPLLST